MTRNVSQEVRNGGETGLEHLGETEWRTGMVGDGESEIRNENVESKRRAKPGLMEPREIKLVEGLGICCQKGFKWRRLRAVCWSNLESKRKKRFGVSWKSDTDNENRKLYWIFGVTILYRCTEYRIWRWYSLIALVKNIRHLKNFFFN